MSLSQDVYIPQVAGGTPRATRVAGAERAARLMFAAWGVTLAAACLVLVAVVASPLAAIAGHPLLASVLRRGFAAACHQMPERSFRFGGEPLAVCARCWGIYCGFAAGVLLYPFLSRVVTDSFVSTRTPARRWLALAAVPTSVDFVLGFTGLWENTHWSRSLTGALAGAAAAAFVVPGVFDFAREVAAKRVRVAGQLTGETIGS